METRSKEIYARSDKKVSIDIIPGHFATNHSHVNYYIDLTSMKIRHEMAKAAAVLLCNKFNMTAIDTIICLEGTEMIGAFLADELAQPGHVKMNSGKDICVLTPEQNANNQMIFRDNTQKIIWGKNILLLMASVSTGKTISRSMECLEYYNGVPVGVAALFSAVHEISGISINTIFDEKDIPNYKTYELAGCELCAKKNKIDAIVNSFGYSKI